jgi:hypothetical protein
MPPDSSQHLFSLFSPSRIVACRSAWYSTSHLLSMRAGRAIPPACWSTIARSSSKEFVRSRLAFLKSSIFPCRDTIAASGSPKLISLLPASSEDLGTGDGVSRVTLGKISSSDDRDRLDQSFTINREIISEALSSLESSNVHDSVWKNGHVW